MELFDDIEVFYNQRRPRRYRSDVCADDNTEHCENSMTSTTTQTPVARVHSGIRWRRVVGIAFALEAALFVVLVPLQRLLGLRVWFAAVAIGCFVFGYAAGLWVARGVASRCALHGFLVGAVATLIYLTICALAPGGIPAAAAMYGTSLYLLNNALRIAGCTLGAMHRERVNGV